MCNRHFARAGFNDQWSFDSRLGHHDMIAALARDLKAVALK
jgi:hypothetical protein